VVSYSNKLLCFSSGIAGTSRLGNVRVLQFRLLYLIDEWSQQEMETFGRCLIATNKDFSVVAKQVNTLLINYFMAVKLFYEFAA